MDERFKSHAWKACGALKPPWVRIPLLPPISMSHGPRSYLRLGRKGLQGDLGGYFNGFVKPGTKLDKRRAARRVRHAKDVSDGKEYRKLWGYWEWC